MKSLILLAFFVKINGLVGCRQVVRHMVLVHAFGGSNPSTPAMKNDRTFVRSFFIVLWSGLHPRMSFALAKHSAGSTQRSA